MSKIEIDTSEVSLEEQIDAAWRSYAAAPWATSARREKQDAAQLRCLEPHMSECDECGYVPPREKENGNG